MYTNLSWLSRNNEAGKKLNVVAKVSENDIANAQQKITERELQEKKELDLTTKYLNDYELKIQELLVSVADLDEQGFKKLLAMETMDVLAKDSNYEGFVQARAAAWSDKIISLIDQDQFELFTNAKTANKLEVAALAVKSLATSAREISALTAGGGTLDAYARDLKDALYQLEAGKSYCMAGGWAGDPTGHAMVYRFEKAADNTFNIYIYNAQGGSEKTQGGMINEGQVESQPCYCFQGVTCSELFFAEPDAVISDGSPVLLKSLIALQYGLKQDATPEEIQEHKNHSVASVLDILSRFGAKLVPADKLPRMFLKVQRSGNCTFQSINCLLLEIMNKNDASNKDFKKLMLEVQFLTLLAFYQKFKDDFVRPEKLQLSYMLWCAIEDYLKTIEVSIRKDIIAQDDPGCVKIFTICHSLLNQLRTNEQQVYKAANTKETVYVFDKDSVDLQEKQRKEQIEHLNQVIVSSSIPKPKVDFSLDVTLGDDIKSFDDLPLILEKLANILTVASGNLCYQAVISQFEITIGKLFSALNKLPKESPLCKKDDAQQLICACLDLYEAGVREANGYASPRVRNTGMAAMAISYMLAVRQDDLNVIHNYGIHIADFKQNDIAVVQDVNVIQQRQELLQFYKDINKDKDKDEYDYENAAEVRNEGQMLFDFYGHESETSPNLSRGNDIAQNKIPEIKLYNDIIIRDTGIIEKIDTKEFKTAHKNRSGEEGGKLSPTTWCKAALFGSVLKEYPDKMKCIGYLKKTALTTAALFSQQPTLVSGVVQYKPGRDNAYFDKYSSCFKDKDTNKNDYPDFKPLIFDAHENDILVQNTIQGDIEHQLKIILKMIEVNPKIRIPSLLKLIEDNVDKLKDRQWRTKIEILLFETSDYAISPIYAPLQYGDDTVMTKINHLTDFCYKQCVKDQSDNDQALDNNKSNWEAMLFVIRLRANALFAKKQYNSPVDSASTQCNAKMLAWLNIREIAINEILLSTQDLREKATERQIIAAAELKQELRELKIARLGLLLGMPPKALLAEQLVQLVTDMLTINSLETFAQTESSAFVRECRHRFILCQHELLQLPTENKDLNQFCNNIIKSYISDSDANKLKLVGNWQMNANQQLSLGDWVIDLTRPVIMRNGIVLEKTMCRVTPAFKRLFGNQQFEVASQKENGINKITFCDAKLGDIEIIDNGTDCYKIFRSIKVAEPDSYEKFLYIHPDTESKLVDHGARIKADLQIDEALCWDHTHWARTSRDTSNKAPELKIYDLHDGDKCLFEVKNGELVSLSEPDLIFCLPPKAQNQALERFDSLGQVETWKSKTTDALHFKFSRYTQERGSQESLRFDLSRDQKTWIYAQDANYKLSEECFTPLNYTTQRYLNLVKIGDESKHKILIPMGELQAKGFDRYSSIDTGISNQDNSKLSRMYFTYEYDEKTNKMTPPTNSLEAKIYLAHIYLAQKRYQEAKEVLVGVSMGDTVSDEAIILMKQLLAHNDDLHDHSPNARAIRLYAYFVFKKLKMRTKDLEIVQKKSNITIWEVYADYLNDIEHVEKSLLLTKEEELWLLKLPEASEELRWREQDLSNHEKTTLILNRSNAQIKSLDMLACAQNTPRPSVNNKFVLTSGFENAYRAIQKASPLQLEAIIYDLLMQEKQSSISRLSKNPPSIQLLLYIAGRQDNFKTVPLSDAKLYKSFDEWLNAKVPSNKSLSNPNQSQRWLANQVSSSGADIASNKSAKAQDMKASAEAIPETPAQLFANNTDNIFKVWQNNFFESEQEKQDREKAEGEKINTLNEASTPSKSNIRLNVNASDKILDGYQGVIIAEQQRYRNDCDAAHEQAAEKRSLKNNFDPKELLAALQEKFKINLGNKAIPEQEQEKQLRELVFIYANKLSDDAQTSQAQRLSIDAHHGSAIALDKIMRAAAMGFDALKKLNPSLTNAEIIAWRQTCLEYMTQVTHRNQANLIYGPLTKLINDTGLDATLTLRYKSDIRDALSQARTYDLCYDNAFLLMFEYFGEMRIRTKQADIIKGIFADIADSDPEAKKDIKSKIFQLIMAGGKTSVIISIILEIIAQNKQLPIVLCHPSQYASVRGNLRNFQKNRYGKDLYALEYTMQDLDDEAVLDEIIQKITDAEKGQNAIITTSSMPQIIELKYILESQRLAKCEQMLKQIDKHTQAREYDKAEKTLAEIWRSVQKLAQINKKFMEDGFGILDECDIILSMLMEVNVPIGEEESLAPQRSQLVHDLYKSLEASQDIDFVNNKQEDLIPEKYSQTIIPKLIADLLTNNLLDPDGLGQHKEAFARYVRGEILPECQLEAATAGDDTKKLEDIAFLRYLKNLKDNPGEANKDVADNIALAAHLVREVVPLALSKSCDRAYGRNLAKDDGSVIPYLGSRTPATTQFGYVYLAQCYQLQTALNTGITKGELRFLVKELQKIVSSYTQSSGMKIDDIAEAKWFLAHTGQKLQAVIEDDELFELAYKHINKPENRQLALAIEAKIAPFHVKYHKERVCSNPISFAEQMHNWVGCSGTPWNWHSYHRKLGELMADDGAEGRVLNAMLERANDPKYSGQYSAVHTIADSDLSAIISKIKNHPKKNQLHCLIDAGGFLKNADNEQVAIELLDAFKPDEIDAVIYFKRLPVDNEGNIKEYFVLKRRIANGLFEDKILDNTSKEEIAKYVKLEKLFVFYDELRVTGTDIAMAPNTIGLETVDPHMPIRTLLQATLRERGYFDQNQDCEFLLTEQGRKEMPNQGATLKDITDALISNQARAASKQTFSSYMAQITNAVRNYAKKILLSEAKQEKFIEFINKFNQLFVSSFDDNPYEQYGKIKGLQNTLAILKQHAIDTIADFLKLVVADLVILDRDIEKLLNSASEELLKNELWQQLIASDSGVAQVIASISDILKDAKIKHGNSLLPDKLIYQQKDNINSDKPIEITEEQQKQKNSTKQDISMNSETTKVQEKEQENEQENEIENEKEESGQVNTGKKGAAEYIPWDLLDKDFIWQKRLAEEEPGLRSVQDVCRRSYPNNESASMGNLAACFSDNLYMSENLRMTFAETDLPFYNKDMKLAKFILIIKDPESNKLKFLLLSQRDGQVFQDWMRKSKPNNLWLVDSDGVEVVENKQHKITELTGGIESDMAIKQAIWQANFFNGDIKYLEKNPLLSQQYLTHSDQAKTMSDYVKKRSCYNSELQNIAYKSNLLKDVRQISTTKKEFDINAPDMSKIKPQDFKLLTKLEDINTLVKKLINENLLGCNLDYFAPEQIKQFLPEYLNSLYDKQISELDTRLIKQLDAERLNKLVLRDGCNYQNLINALTDEHLTLLTNKVLIDLLSNEQIIKLKLPEAINKLPVSKTKIEALTPAQVSLLTNKSLIDLLSSKQIQSLQLPEAINQIPATMIGALTPKQLEVLTDKALIDLLDNEQITHLKLPEAINQLPTSETKIAALTFSQVSLLTNQNLINLLKDEQIQSLQLPGVINNIPKAKVGLLTPAQLSLLTNEDLIEQLSSEQIKSLQVFEAINSIPPGKVNCLTADQMRLLNNKTLISHISGDKLNEIKLESHYHHGDFKFLAENLEKGQILELTSEILLAKLQHTGVMELLKSGRLKDFNNEQIKAVIKAAVVSCALDKVILSLTSKQIDDLDDDVLDIIIANNSAMEKLCDLELRTSGSINLNTQNLINTKIHLMGKIGIDKLQKRHDILKNDACSSRGLVKNMKSSITKLQEIAISTNTSNQKPLGK